MPGTSRFIVAELVSFLNHDLPQCHADALHGDHWVFVHALYFSKTQFVSAPLLNMSPDGPRGAHPREMARKSGVRTPQNGILTWLL